MNPSWAIGLMTGTVLDGMIDIAAVRTDGDEIEELGPWRLAPYPAGLKALLSAALAAALEWQFEGEEPAIFRAAEAALTAAQAEAVGQFLGDCGLPAREIAIVGFHGQTVLHRAPAADRRGNTRQLGDGGEMARKLGIRVAYDFRTADMRAGGQGAPLAAIYHAALLRKAGGLRDSAVLNLGGVANITWWGGGDALVAFDTGPASAPLNDWMVACGLGEMDRDGRLAARGRVDETRLALWLEHPFFSASPPKSLDRNSFSASLANGLSPEDGAATLTALIAAAVAKALEQLPRRPAQIVVCGGGRKNPAILDALRARARVAPEPAEAVGWRGDAIEAECFAYLGMRTLRGLPITFPLTTGVKAPLKGGRIAAPRRV
ncbi:MAG TPA: anhydro-N-acetylmuramic acid kinase [Steroidobacteraceae bacterium]|nr:anhydro-N-acetylmuramic acid kinase [Steroidobacteraceae bacterium]